MSAQAEPKSLMEQRQYLGKQLRDLELHIALGKDKIDSTAMTLLKTEQALLNQLETVLDARIIHYHKLVDAPNKLTSNDEQKWLPIATAPNDVEILTTGGFVKCSLHDRFPNLFKNKPPQCAGVQIVTKITDQEGSLFLVKGSNEANWTHIQEPSQWMPIFTS